jgi:prepilin-type N-terminal cleavage/methylation domain-containing protein/prepilin-type processing-associated H-X9-DG protein
MNHLNRLSHRGRGFTLVELLVTVGIIAVLIAILVPVLSIARNKANETRCLSNQRQFMQAMLSYAVDNAGYLPAPNWDGGSNPASPAAPNPPGWLYDPSQLIPNNTFQNGDSTHPSDVTHGLLYQYLNTLQVYHCPMDDGTWGTNTVQILSTYIMNGAVCDYGYQQNLRGEKLRAFKSSAILFWELPLLLIDNGVVNDGADFPAEGITTRHSNGSTVAFADGHAELLTWTAFTNDWYTVTPGPAPGIAPGMLWCAPRSQYNDGGESVYSGTWPPSAPPQPTSGG